MTTNQLYWLLFAILFIPLVLFQIIWFVAAIPFALISYFLIGFLSFLVFGDADRLEPARAFAAIETIPMDALDEIYQKAINSYMHYSNNSRVA